MTCFVDDMAAEYRAFAGAHRMIMFHMLADSDEELHAMAARIGVQRKWWQSPEKTSGSHYDISKAKRKLAVDAGAVEVTIKQMAMMNLHRKITGQLGTPAQADAWLKDFTLATKLRAEALAHRSTLPQGKDSLTHRSGYSPDCTHEENHNARDSKV